jgi:bifunctional NMN adenylyltransferase/nudix hydrolase
MIGTMQNAPLAGPMNADVAVYVGRFQPFHNGHLALLQRALALAPLVVVVIGSAHQARTPKNPFTAAERAEMIHGALSPQDRARVRMLPLRDCYDLPRWVDAVRQGVANIVQKERTHPHAAVPAAHTEPGGAVELGHAPQARVVLVGHFKDPTSDYLRSFHGWAVESVPRIPVADGTQIRNELFAGDAQQPEPILATLAPQVPPGTVHFMRHWLQQPHFTRLQHEWRMLNEYHAAWAGTPYPVVLVTVDAVVRCAGHVLLIRRAHAPGVGLLAVPGGFIEQRETTLQSCLRELQEETHLDVPEATLRQCLKASAVFDHPDRSLRGRTITHGFFFDLGDGALPHVRADDDAQAVEWVAVEWLPRVEDQFHDDHFHMLDHFLGLTGG